MAYCADSLSRGLSHTFRLLFQPFRLLYWLKVSILAFFIQGFSILSSNSYLQQLPAPNELDRWAEQALEALPMIVGVLFASMFIGIIMQALQSCARFMLFDAVRDGFIYYRSSLQRHFSGIVSLFLWNVIVKIAFFILIFIAVLVLLIPNVLLGTMANNVIGLVIIFTIDAIFALFVILILVAHAMILDGIVLPQMVVQSKGILEAWGNAFRMIKDNFGEFLGYLSIRVAISLAHMFIIFVLVFAIGIFSLGIYAASTSTGALEQMTGFSQGAQFHWMQIPIQFLITFLLLPIPLFKDAYALCFLKNVQNDDRFEPVGGRPIEPDRRYSPAQPPILNGEGPEIKNETDLFNGPVSFKDIPSVDSTSESKSAFDANARPPDVTP